MKKMEERIRNVIMKLLGPGYNFSEEKIFQRFQDTKEISADLKPTLKEICEIALDCDIQKDQKDQSETSPQKDQALPKPTYVKPTHLQCPKCSTITKFRASKAKRRRKQCPHCKTKREITYWIPMVQNQKDQSETSPQKDQSLPTREISEMELRKQKDQKDHPPVASETFSQNRDTLLGHPDVQTVLKLIAQHLYPTNIAKQSGFSKSKVTRILQKLQKANIIIETNKYPKFYDILIGPKGPGPSWIEKIEDIHRVEYVMHIQNPKFPVRPTDTFHNLYDKEFPQAKKTELGGWTRYELNWAENPNYPHGWDIQVNRKKIILKYKIPLRDITDPSETQRFLETQLPYAFFQSKGIQIDPTSTELRAGGGHARIKFGIEHIDNLGVRQAVSVINETTGVEIFHADNSEKCKALSIEKKNEGPGVETSIAQAAKLISMPQQMEALHQKLDKLSHIIQSMQTERSQVQQLINTFTNSLQGAKPQMEIKNPSGNMFT